MSRSLLDISNLIKSKIIKNQLIDILELIPEKKKFLKNIVNTNFSDDIHYSLLKKKNSINIIYYEPMLYISPNIFDIDDFILQMLCFLMESHYEDDDINKKYNLKENFNKIQSDIKHNFELISSEIKNTFDKFFYKENGFFSKDEYNNITLKNELIALYVNNKVSDIDERVILIFHLLFEPNYLNFSKISSFQSVFNNMYNLLADIMKNYENHKLIPEATDLKYIKENFPLSKLILTYQRYKIFFTYEDFSNYFYTSYNNEIINQDNYPIIFEFNLKLHKINYSTFNKIYEIFKSEFNSELKIEHKCNNLELELQKDTNNIIILCLINIYKAYGINPKIQNYLNKILYDYKNYINKKKNYLKVITEKIQKNILFIRFKKNIENKNKDDIIYYENLLDFFYYKTKTIEDTQYLEEIVEKNPEYLVRLKEIIYNLIMEKLNIKYIDLNNEDYEQYYIQIKNKLSPQKNISDLYSKSIIEPPQITDELFINQKNISISFNLIEDSSDEISSINSSDEIEQI